jgi:hypothetical protein
VAVLAPLISEIFETPGGIPLGSIVGAGVEAVVADDGELAATPRGSNVTMSNRSRMSLERMPLEPGRSQLPTRSTGVGEQ